MKKILRRFATLLLALLLFAAPALAIPESGEEQLALLEEIIGWLEEYAFYRPTAGGLSLEGITAARLEEEENLLRGLVESWQSEDKYGRFFTEEEYNTVYDVGEILYGIGVQVDDTMQLGVYVEGLLPGGGARRSGMETGAQIVYVDGVDIRDAVFADVRELFLGEAETKLEIGYINPGSAEVLFEEITRSILNSRDIRGHIVDGTDIGYMAIDRFGLVFDSFRFDTYYNDILPNGGASSVIIDLRGNRGGQLETLVAMLNLMLPEEGYVLCKQVSANKSWDVLSTGWDEESLDRYSGMIWEPEQIVILVDGGSASASEIFAGTLQAYGLATIVGEATYGKSHSQYHIDLSSGDILIFTTHSIELFQTGSYDDSGIIPDYEAAPKAITGAEAGLAPLDTSRALFRQSLMTGRIAAMQERLAFLGYYRTEPSGVFDDYTLWCLNRFQAANELEQGRFANAVTLRALDKAAMEHEIWVDAQLEFALELLLKSQLQSILYE